MPLTQEQIDNAGLDTQSLGDVVNGAVDLNGDGTVTTRTGANIKTLSRVIDDLSQEDIGESAAALINQRIDDAGFPIATMSTNLDTIATAGFYQATSVATGNPVAATVLVIHTQGRDARAKQVAWRTDSNANAGGWVRVRGSSGTWQPWEELAVAADVTDISDRLTNVVFAQNYSNIYNPLTVTEGFVLAPSGGGLNPNPDFYVTDFIPVSPSESIAITPAPANRRVAYYNGSFANTFTTVIAAGAESFVVSSNPSVRYMRVSPRIAVNPPLDLVIVRGESLPETPTYPERNKPIQEGQRNKAGGFVGINPDGSIPAVVKSPLFGKKIAGLGDSITYGYIPRNYPGYPGQLASYLIRMAEAFGATALNYGISGSTLAYHATRNPMSRRFAAMDDDADLIILMGGTNDVRNGIALGTMGDSTDATFYGALDVLAQGLLNKFRYNQGTEIGAKKMLVFMTPIRLFDAGEPDGLDALLPSYCEAVKEVAEKYAIPVFDAYNDSGLTPELFRTLQGTATNYTDLYNPYVTDGTHPTQEGHEIFAARLAGFIRGLM